MRIRERVYEGKIDTPKSGKPRESALSDGTLSALEEWRGLAITLDANAFVFPSENLKVPISSRNIWARSASCRDWRTVRPGMGDVSFPGKTNATLSRKAGVDAKVSADQRGHGLESEYGSLHNCLTASRSAKPSISQESAVALKRRKTKPPENA